MDANPEVMPIAAKPTARSVSMPGGRDGQAKLQPRADPPARAAAPVRLSEDPMRRTDRYRLVMPWSVFA